MIIREQPKMKDVEVHLIVRAIESVSDMLIITDITWLINQKSKYLVVPRSATIVETRTEVPPVPTAE